MLDLYPEATVAGSKVALTYLKSLTHRPFSEQIVKGGDKIDLGGSHVIEFVMAPNLHWPDTMFSFDHATGAEPVATSCLLFAMVTHAFTCQLLYRAKASIAMWMWLPGSCNFVQLVKAPLGCVCLELWESHEAACQA